MAQLHLQVVTPEEKIFDDMVDMVDISTDEGILGILPNHTSLMARIKPGEMVIKHGGRQQLMVVGSGFMQVENSSMKVMTDLAQDAEKIDEKAVEEARKRAEKALEEKLTAEEHAETLAALEKSLAQLKIKRRHRVR